MWCQYLVLGFVLLRMQSMYIKEPKGDGTRIEKRVFPCHTSQEWSTFTYATCVYILCLASVSLLQVFHSVSIYFPMFLCLLSTYLLLSGAFIPLPPPPCPVTVFIGAW